MDILIYNWPVYESKTVSVCLKLSFNSKCLHQSVLKVNRPSVTFTFLLPFTRGRLFGSPCNIFVSVSTWPHITCCSPLVFSRISHMLKLRKALALIAGFLFQVNPSVPECSGVTDQLTVSPDVFPTLDFIITYHNEPLICRQTSRPTKFTHTTSLPLALWRSACSGSW